MYRTTFMPGMHIVLCGLNDKQSYADPEAYGPFTTGNDGVDWLKAHLGGSWEDHHRTPAAYAARRLGAAGARCPAGMDPNQHEVIPLQEGRR